MKTSITSTYRPPLLRAVYAFLIAITALSAMPRNAHAQIYVSQVNGIINPIGFVNQYDASSGTLIKDHLITGLKTPTGLVVAGNTLFVANRDGGTVGAYDATSGTGNANFITGLKEPMGLAVAGNTLFVASSGTTGVGTVVAYNAGTGAAINPNPLITALNGPTGLAVTGNTLFVATEGNATVGEYNATSGTAINATFITLQTEVTGLAVSTKGNVLFVGNFFAGTVGEYDAKMGSTINGKFIKGLTFPSGIAIKAAK
jgi:outer membrane protein assembly factor BamB